MANYMFVLRPTSKTIKTVCPLCASRGEVITACPLCHGEGTQKHSVPQYYVQDKPIEITHTDRDPKTGVLRYWEDASEFYYETTYPELNRYAPAVPHGLHLVHDDVLTAKRECERINEYLLRKNGKNLARKSETKLDF